MEVNLFFLVPSRQLGGCTSYTVHLVYALRQQGHTCNILRVGARSSGPKPFAYGLSYRTVTIQEARTLARNTPSLISYCFWKKMAAPAGVLLRAGVPMVSHDPAEFHDEWLDFARRFGCRVLVIRERNLVTLRNAGLRVEYVPHPFVESGEPAASHRFGAVCIARVDFRKHTHDLIVANRELEPEQAVHLFGEVNRMYEFHYLRQHHPDWREWYHGEFPDRLGAAASLASSANYVVDLTAIKGDGGGTQYTFFEAWEAHKPLILNRAWMRDGEELRAGVNCLAVGSPAELVDILRSDPRSYADIVEGGIHVLKAHSPEEVVPRYLEAICG